jgi:hypothetical protein
MKGVLFVNGLQFTVVLKIVGDAGLSIESDVV